MRQVGAIGNGRADFICASVGEHAPGSAIKRRRNLGPLRCVRVGLGAEDGAQRVAGCPPAAGADGGDLRLAVTGAGMAGTEGGRRAAGADGRAMAGAQGRPVAAGP
ncbi:MAG: hypothetical protein ACJ8R9_26045 [Steroidobacteraceae bacterium]